MKYFISASFLFLASFSGTLFSQSLLTVHPKSLNFGNVNTAKTDSLPFWIVNNSSSSVHVRGIHTFHKEFFLKDTVFSIAANESVSVKVFFRAKDNLSFHDVVVISTNGKLGSAAVAVSATAKYPDTTYAFTQNLRDEPLKTALHNFVNNHTSLGYNTGRDKMFETVDDYNNNDTIECVYTGRKIYAPTRTDAQNQGFNTEHTWPQSFFNSNEPMKSDLFHLYPTDNTPNNVRANYPFGTVISQITYDSAGSKLGKNSIGQTVFEPRTIHKGNVARSILYFVVRYDSNEGGFLDATQEFWYRRWNWLDTVDARERTRCDRIASFQHKRNPFIDHPEFIDRISKFTGTATTATAPTAIASEDSLPFGYTPVNQNATWDVYIINSGNAPLTISSFQHNTASPFHLSQTVNSVHADSFALVHITFSPTIANEDYVDTLVILSNATNTAGVTIPLSGTSKEPSSAVHESPVARTFSLSQNYPNPFNPVTAIGFSLLTVSNVTLDVYDIEGRDVATLLRNKRTEAGEHTIEFNAGNLPSGVYFYRLTVGTTTLSKSMILLK